MRHFLLLGLLLALLAFTSCGPTHYLSKVSVSRRLLYRTNLYLNMLASEVRTYNWVNCNKARLHRTLSITSQLLHQIKGAVAGDSGNEVKGVDNQVIGEGNVVIGSRNQLVGFNNWVFVSDYRNCPYGRIHVDEGVLVIGGYRVELANLAQVLEDPTLVIHPIGQDELDALRLYNNRVSYFFR